MVCWCVQGKYLAADGGPAEARLNKYKGRYAEAESRYVATQGHLTWTI